MFDLKQALSLGRPVFCPNPECRTFRRYKGTQREIIAIFPAALGAPTKTIPVRCGGCRKFFELRV